MYLSKVKKLCFYLSPHQVAFCFEKHETKSLILGEEESSKSLVKSGIKFDISM